MNKEQDEISKKKVIPSWVLEFFFLFGYSVVVYVLAARYDFLEQIVEFSRQHEAWELDEFITIAIFLMIALFFLLIKKWRELQVSKMELTLRNKKLQDAILEIKQLKGIIPICASCKSIRNDQGFWQQVEVYIHNHTDARFSHGICPDCMKKLYPEFIDDEL